MNPIVSYKKIFGILFGLYLFLLLSNSALADEESKILLINSNSDIKKYRTVQEAFKQAISLQIYDFDLGKWNGNVNIKSMEDYDADIVCCIGAKACVFARNHFKDKPLVFSSIMNWQRMSLLQQAYGVSNELPARMPLYMFRSVFPKIKKIGMLYSTQYTAQWFADAAGDGSELNIEIVGKTVSSERQTEPALRGLIRDVDALWLISDPLVIPDKNSLYRILNICDENKIPVFSYHNAFVNLGVMLSVAVDNPTIGRQAAGIVEQLLSGGKPEDRVQYPAGSDISLDLKKAKAYQLEYNSDALGLINNIIR